MSSPNPAPEKIAALNLVRMPLADVNHPHPKNPRDIPAADSEEIRVLDASLSHDYFDPIVWNSRNGLLVSGHVRVPRLIALGFTHADVSVVDYDEATHEARLLAGNAYSGKNNDDKLDALLTSLRTSEVDPVLAMLVKMPKVKEIEVPHDAAPRINEAAELNKRWQVKPGDVWQIGGHRLKCGNSTEQSDVTALLAGNKPRLMVSDPPYGVEYKPEWRADVDRKSGKTVGARSMGTVTNDDRAAWAAAYILSPAVITYIWHAGLYAGVVERGLISAGYEMRSQIVWNKKRFVLSRGSYHWGHEPCWYAVRKGETANFLGGRKQSTLWADIIDHFEPKAPDPICAIQLDAETVYAFPASASTVWSISNDKACGGGAQHTEAARMHGASHPQPRRRRPRSLPRLRHHHGRSPKPLPHLLRHGDQPRLLRRHPRPHAASLPGSRNQAR